MSARIDMPPLARWKKTAFLLAACGIALLRKRILYPAQKLTHEALCQAFRDCNRIMRSVAVEKGVRLIDVDSLLSGRSEFFSDHVHLTAKGGHAIAKIVAEALVNEMKGKQNGSKTMRLKKPL